MVKREVGESVPSNPSERSEGEQSGAQSNAPLVFTRCRYCLRLMLAHWKFCPCYKNSA